MHNHPPTALLNSRSIEENFQKEPLLFLDEKKKQFSPPKLCTIHILKQMLAKQKDNKFSWYLLSVDDQAGDRLCRDHVGRPDVLPGIKRSRKQSEKWPPLRSMIIQSRIALHFRCSLRAVTAQQHPAHLTQAHSFTGEAIENIRLNGQSC